MINRLFSTFVEYRVTDIVNGRDVNLYRRKDGTYFLAHSRFDAIFFYVDLS